MINSITHCKSDGNYASIHRRSEPPIFIAKTLRYLEEMLTPYGFSRVHNSYLVNMKHVKKYHTHDGGYLILVNDEKIRISRSRKNALLKYFQNK